MKKLLRFSGFISLVCAAVGLVLLLTTYASSFKGNGVDKGIDVIFGGRIGGMSNMGFFTFVLALAATFLLVLYAALRAMNKEKNRAFLSLVIAFVLAIAGVSIFFALPKYYERNNWGSFYGDGFRLAPGWIVAAVLFFVAAAICFLNVVVKQEEPKQPELKEEKGA